MEAANAIGGIAQRIDEAGGQPSGCGGNFVAFNRQAIERYPIQARCPITQRGIAARSDIGQPPPQRARSKDAARLSSCLGQRCSALR
jgi:hypothetical protein